MRLPLTLTVCLIFLFIYVRSQTPTYDEQLVKVKNVIPPSPEAAALGKYGDIPVGLYQGIPEISIPIYELQGRSISLPISISYHASGIKVGEIASRVGLGWTLNAGGAITRSVRGLPDEIPEGYLAVRAMYPNPIDLSDPVSGTLPHPTYVPMVYQRTRDSEPDLFFFNAMGKSFKFHFGANGLIVSHPYSNVKLKADFLNKQFTATLEDGTKLVFGTEGFIEKTYNYGLSYVVPSSNNFVSTWYLKSIKTPTDETITFKYSPHQVDFDSYYSETDYRLLGSGPTPCDTNEKPIARHSEVQRVFSLNLDSIKSDLTSIAFIKDASARLDLPDNYALDRIKVISRERNKVIFDFVLGHSFSTANGAMCMPNKGTGEYARRLKLDYVRQVKPNTTEKLKEWKFDYNPMPLPARGSYAQDHWGYNNGAPNSTFLPAAPGFLIPDHYSANREVDPEYTQAEMLTRITYPTGGTSTFVFEQNAYEALDSVYDNTYELLHRDLNPPGDGTTQLTTTFDIRKPQNVNLIVSGVYSTAYRTAHINSMPKAWIIGPEGYISAPVVEGGNLFLYLKKLGTYTLKVTWVNATYTENYDSWINARIQYDEYLGYSNVVKYAGGLRIKSTEDTDGIDTAKTIRRFYSYADPFVSVPLDEGKDYLGLCRERGFTGDCYKDFQARYSNTLSSLASVQGASVGYGKVTVSVGKNYSNGRTVHRFSHATDSLIDLSKIFPYPPTVSRDNRRGLLLSKTVYDKNGVIKQKDSTVYKFVRKDRVKAYKAGSNKQHYTEDGTDINFNTSIYIHYVYFTIESEQTKTLKTINKIYDDAGQNPVVTTTDFFYDNPLSLEPIRIETTDSKGQVEKKIVRTALDKAAIHLASPLSATASIAIDSMVKRNMISVPIQTEKYVGATLMERSTIDFKLWTTKNFALPELGKQQVLSNPAETRVQFIDYDLKGNLLAQRKSSDMKMAYLYDHAGSYPIAEVVNADAASVAFTSFESDGSGNWTTITGTRFVNTNSPSGRKYLQLGSLQKTGLTAATRYRVSFWISNAANVSVTGTGVVLRDLKSRQGQNGWKYREMEISGATTITISGTGNIDEVRLYPIVAQMKTFAYEPLIGIKSVIDDNGVMVTYSYDEFGRLKYIRDSAGKILKNFEYHYISQD